MDNLYSISRGRNLNLSETMRKVTANRKQVSEEVGEDITASFHRFDLGTKGFLNREDLKMAMVSILRVKPTRGEVDTILAHAEEYEGEKGIGLRGFREIMMHKLILKDPEDEIRRMFEALDVQSNGYLTFGGIVRIVENLQHNGSREKNLDHLTSLSSKFALLIEQALKSAVFGSINLNRISYRDFSTMIDYFHQNFEKSP